MSLVAGEASAAAVPTGPQQTALRVDEERCRSAKASRSRCCTERDANLGRRTPSPHTAFPARVLQRGVVLIVVGIYLTLTFPIGERTEVAEIQGATYTLVLRGNEVVSIDPPGRRFPLYQRGHYRGGETLWRQVTRYAPDVEIDWS